MSSGLKCRTCGSEMIQKSRPRLLVVGAGLVAAAGLAISLPQLWPASIPPGLTGIYLLVWGTIGKGRWCRTCKTFPITP